MQACSVRCRYRKYVNDGEGVGIAEKFECIITRSYELICYVVYHIQPVIMGDKWFFFKSLENEYFEAVPNVRRLFEFSVHEIKERIHYGYFR